MYIYLGSYCINLKHILQQYSCNYDYTMIYLSLHNYLINMQILSATANREANRKPIATKQMITLLSLVSEEQSVLVMRINESVQQEAYKNTHIDSHNKQRDCLQDNIVCY